MTKKFKMIVSMILALVMLATCGALVSSALSTRLTNEGELPVSSSQEASYYNEISKSDSAYCVDYDGYVTLKAGTSTSIVFGIYEYDGNGNRTMLGGESIIRFNGNADLEESTTNLTGKIATYTNYPFEFENTVTCNQMDASDYFTGNVQFWGDCAYFKT